MEHKISVIIPVYNVEKYLQECLDSIFNQTHRNFEMICIDDGSSDSSYEILEKNKKEHEDISMTIIKQKNSGLSAARNKGIETAKGEYILFLDSDDFLDLKSLELINEKIEEGIDLITFDMLNFDDITGKQEERTRVGNDFSDIMLANEFFEKSKKFTLLASTLHCYRVNYLKENNLIFTKGILHEDEEFSIRSYLKLNKVAYINKMLYIRRVRMGSIMHGNRYENNKSLDSYLFVLREFNKFKKLGSKELTNLIDKRSTLLLSNLIRYKSFSLKNIKEVSKELDIKLNLGRIYANIIVFKVLKRG